MSISDNDIDKLFLKKFGSFEAKTSEEEWRALSPKLSRFNFLKFSFVTFNVYYLMLLTALAGTVAYSGVKNMELSKKVRTLEQNLKNQESQPQEETINQSSTPTEALDKNEPEAVSTQSQTGKKSNTSLNSNTLTSVVPVQDEEKEKPVSKEEIKDTAHIAVPQLVKPDSLSVSKIKRIKKTLVVKPQVVIVKKDTVVITKRRK